jgi:hypothetical protein
MACKRRRKNSHRTFILIREENEKALRNWGAYAPITEFVEIKKCIYLHILPSLSRMKKK